MFVFDEEGGEYWVMNSVIVLLLYGLLLLLWFAMLLFVVKGIYYCVLLIKAL